MLKISNLSNHISRTVASAKQLSLLYCTCTHSLALSFSHTPWSEALWVPLPPFVRVPCQCLQVKRGEPILWSWKETNTMRKAYVNSYQVNLQFQITVTLSWCASLLPLSSLAVCLVNLAGQFIPRSFICQPSLLPSYMILCMTNVRLKYNLCYLLRCLWTASKTR